MIATGRLYIANGRDLYGVKSESHKNINRLLYLVNILKFQQGVLKQNANENVCCELSIEAFLISLKCMVLPNLNASYLYIYKPVPT